MSEVENPETADATPIAPNEAASGGQSAAASSEASGAIEPSQSVPASGEHGELGELEVLRAERDQLRSEVLRRRADFENFRKRVERDRDLAATEAMAALFRELLPTVDNLERALGAEADDVTLRQGVEMILREFVSLLERHGVTASDPAGGSFDPVSHQALLHEETAEHDDGDVVEVFRKSYHFRGRLLRPALVKVAKGLSQSENPAAEAREEGSLEE